MQWLASIVFTVFMAVWTIFYGLVQASAPSLVRRSPDGLSREVPAARLWSALLVATIFAWGVAFFFPTMVGTVSERMVFSISASRMRLSR